MVPSNWVLGGKFKYVFTNVLAGVQEPQGIITTMGAPNTPGLKEEKGKAQSLGTSQERAMTLNCRRHLAPIQPQKMEPGD